MTQHAYIRTCAHAGTDLDNETGGWLAGKACQDELTGEYFIVIDTTIPALYTEKGAAHLTFTSESQVALHETLMLKHPEKTLLGWYHTHPHMGVFFSQWDAWIHRYFFPSLWQVALVIEPYNSMGGFFTHDANGNLVSNSYQGFYELTRKDRSLVFWRNLHQPIKV
jgi:proteasome lid subunit RPN8/RPN11